MTFVWWSRLKALLKMNDQAGQALLASAGKAQDKFVKDAGLPDAGPTTGLAGEFLDPRQLHFTLSDLKRRIRQAVKGVDPDGFRLEDLRRMAGAIDETIQTAPMRRMSTGKAVDAEKTARVRESFNNANDLTAAAHSLFDSKNMKDLLKVKTRKAADGTTTREMDMPNGMFLDNIFKPKDSKRACKKSMRKTWINNWPALLNCVPVASLRIANAT